MQPLILDLDDSVGALPGERRWPLQAHCDALRFACTSRQLRAFSDLLATGLTAAPTAAFLGSGDFHHLSLPLIQHAAAGTRSGLRLVVFDNHPDNMRFPFGVHCGSWVARAAALPGVESVDVVGITSPDIGLAHAWENQITPLANGRLRYWSIGVATRWASAVGLGHAFRNFESEEALMAALLQMLRGTRSPIYLSIDKDVLHPDDARTNWDQGRLRTASLLAAIDAVRLQLAGFDVCGEVSIARYPQRWKRWMTSLDHQPVVTPQDLAAWQAQQQQLNLQLWSTLVGE